MRTSRLAVCPVSQVFLLRVCSAPYSAVLRSARVRLCSAHLFFASALLSSAHAILSHVSCSACGNVLQMLQMLWSELTSWKASHNSVEPSTSVSTRVTMCPLSGGPFFLFQRPTYLGRDMRVHSTMMGTATAISTAKGIIKYRKALSCCSTATHLQARQMVLAPNA